VSTYGLWLSAAGMQVNDHKQTVLANNLANSGTVGFKHDLAVVRQRLVESRENPGAPGVAHPVMDGLSGGLETLPTHVSFTQGSIEPTGRSLDIAIDGEGFFTVSDGQQERYTRDGVFTLNADGELVLSAGGGRWKLQGGGASIQTEPGQGKISVSSSGVIRQGDNVIGEIELVTNPDKQQLKKAGENLFENRGNEMVPADGILIAEAKEHSTFDAMQGLASMIQVTRAYQLNATMVQLQDQMTGQAVSRVGKVA